MNGRGVALTFYDQLFEQHPEIKPLFKQSSEEMIDKLVGVLELVVFSFEDKGKNLYALQESLMIPLRDLGRKHEEKGVRPEHYPIANALLLYSIEKEIGSVVFNEIRETWQCALDHITAAMLNTSLDAQLNNGSTRNSFFRQVFDGLIRKWK